MFPNEATLSTSGLKLRKRDGPIDSKIRPNKWQPQARKCILLVRRFAIVKRDWWQLDLVVFVEPVCYESTSKSRDTIRRRFVVVRVRNQPIRTVATHERKLQTCPKCHRPGDISPITTNQNLHINIWFLNNTMCFPTTVTFICVVKSESFHCILADSFRILLLLIEFRITVSCIHIHSRAGRLLSFSTCGWRLSIRGTNDCWPLMGQATRYFATKV